MFESEFIKNISDISTAQRHARNCCNNVLVKWGRDSLKIDSRKIYWQECRKVGHTILERKLLPELPERPLSDIYDRLKLLRRKGILKDEQAPAKAEDTESREADSVRVDLRLRLAKEAEEETPKPPILAKSGTCALSYSAARDSSRLRQCMLQLVDPKGHFKKFGSLSCLFSIYGETARAAVSPRWEIILCKVQQALRRKKRELVGRHSCETQESEALCDRRVLSLSVSVPGERERPLRTQN